MLKLFSNLQPLPVPRMLRSRAPKIAMIAPRAIQATAVTVNAPAIAPATDLEIAPETGIADDETGAMTDDAVETSMEMKT